MIFLFLTDQSFIFSTIVIEDPQVDKGENSYDDHPFCKGIKQFFLFFSWGRHWHIMQKFVQSGIDKTSGQREGIG